MPRRIAVAQVAPDVLFDDVTSLKILWRSFDALLTALGITAGAVFALLSIAISVDVVLRNVGVVSFPWLLEITEYILYGATFLAAPWVLREGRHVRVDVFVECLPASGRYVSELVAEFIGLIVCGVLFWYAGRVTVDAYSRGEVLFKELVIPEWWLLLVLPVSAALMLVEFGRRIHSTLVRGPDRSLSGPSPI